MFLTSTVKYLVTEVKGQHTLYKDKLPILSNHYGITFDENDTLKK